MSKKNTRTIVLGCFLLYCIIMLFLLFDRQPLTSSLSYREQLQQNLSLTPFHTIRIYLRVLASSSNRALLRAAIINLVGNVVTFIPLGFFLPYLWPRFRSFFWFVCTVILIVGCIEVLQLVTLLGSCDIDDLLLNTSGAVIGFVFYYLLVFLSGNIERKAEQK